MRIPRGDVQFVEQRVIKTSDAGPADQHTYEYRVVIPDFLAKWDVWDYWEKCRFDSMRDNLTKSDILFDVGAEVGWISVIYAKYVGPDRIVLFESSPAFWPNIQATWRANGLADPMACYLGLVGQKTIMPRTLSVDNSYYGGWPAAAYGDELTDRLEYQYLHKDVHLLPQTRLDGWSSATGIRPTALTIDVEGAELDVLSGAQGLLDGPRMKIWVSIHPDLMENNYYREPGQLHDLMSYYGYHGTCLGVDHEEHWFFQ